jgi:HlyD family secretion protein
VNRISKRTVVAVATCAAVLAVGAIAVNAKSSSDPAAQDAALYAAAERRDLDIVAEAAGLVEPIRLVEVKSKASGEVTGIQVETGDEVAAGTLLAGIDPRDVQSALEQAVADLEAARVKLLTATAQRNRMEQLRESAVVTEQEYESAVEAAASAGAAVIRAETTLRLARERRNDVTIRAPIAGTIIERTVEPGQIIASATSNVSGGTTLFRMADLSEMQVRALVDETDIGQIRSGLPVDVTVEAYRGRTFPGEVLKVEPQAVVEQNVTMFPVLVKIANPDGLLKPGMNAEVSIQIASRTDVVTVPNSAVVGLRDIAQASAAVGVDPAAVQAAMRAAAPQRAAPNEAAGDSSGNAPDAGATGAALAERCAQFRQRVMAAGGPGSMSDEDRARMRECRPQGGRRIRMGGDGRGPGAGAAGPANAFAARPGLVFVQGPGGPEPRRVMLGVNDWEHSEIVSGLEAGERVILVTVARLQMDQQEMTDRIRERTSGPMGGGGVRVRVGG